MFTIRPGVLPYQRAGISLALICLCALLPACSQIREDVGQPFAVEASRLAAANNYHQVLDLLGPPHRLSVGDAGMVFLYEEIDLIEDQVGINLSHNGFALFKAVAARGIAERRLLLVSFDRQGQNQALKYDEETGAAAWGAALQIIFAVAGVVDDGDLSQSPKVHEWGFALLEPDLPIALNRQQQLDSGSGGIQQQGTPTAVGQQTLELRSR